MDFVETILKGSRVRYREYRCNSPQPIWLTSGNQLLSSHAALSRFATVDPHYRGWHAHHVIETRDLEGLGASGRFPRPEEQLTVLLPQAAHIKRSNAVRRTGSLPVATASATELLVTYAATYALLGNYSGGGEHRIRAELMAIARAILTHAGLA